MTTNNRMFHRVTIAGLTFDGILSADGPYVACREGGGVALGVSGLREFQPQESPNRRHGPRFGWWVVKYRDEARVELTSFSLTHIRRLSDEFGLVILTERDPFPSDRTRRYYFFTSPAWDALRQWVTKHPRIARAQADCDPYLPGWYGRARAEARAVNRNRVVDTGEITHGPD